MTPEEMEVSRRLRYSIALPRPGDGIATPDALVAITRAAEANGFEACSMDDHPFPLVGPEHLGHQTFDPFVVLGFLISETSTIKLHTNIAVVPFRSPFVLAKAAATLDYLSAGRLILGLGAGYKEEEFTALGADFSQRNRLVDEAIPALRAAWSGEPLHQSTDDWEAVGNTMLPLPAQPGGPPIWMGGNSKLAMRRAIAHCEGWSPFQIPSEVAPGLHTSGLPGVQAMAQRIAEAREFAAEIGRERDFDVCYVNPDPTWTEAPDADLREQVEQLEEIGASWLSVTFPTVPVEEYTERIARFADAVGARGRVETPTS